MTDGVSDFSVLEYIKVKENFVDSRDVGEGRFPCTQRDIPLYCFLPALSDRKYSKQLSFIKRLKIVH
jgi:hypothetical protein